jgi:hypothetical protein
MIENQALYAKIGYVEYDRRTEKGYAWCVPAKAARMMLPFNYTVHRTRAKAARAGDCER